MEVLALRRNTQPPLIYSLRQLSHRCVNIETIYSTRNLKVHYTVSYKLFVHQQL
jgi:hypothetical protein